MLHAGAPSASAALHASAIQNALHFGQYGSSEIGGEVRSAHAMRSGLPIVLSVAM